MKKSFKYPDFRSVPRFILLSIVFMLTSAYCDAKIFDATDTTIFPRMNPANYDENKELTFESLPVKLTFFKLTVNTSHILLEWGTSLERGNRGFEIERKMKGSNHFETIAFVATKHAGGNHDLETRYSYSDPNKFQHGMQYRLKQIDFTGRITYSKIVLADGADAIAKSVLYPNPVNNNQATLVFSTDRKRIVKISYHNGQPLKIINTNLSSIELNDLKKGIYLVTIHDLQNENSEAIKMVVN